MTFNDALKIVEMCVKGEIEVVEAEDGAGCTEIKIIKDAWKRIKRAAKDNESQWD
tara:strand:+ start:8214 stop:8378 length:165 start_codon:yes stop_codon:yes gene_type:complete